MRTAGVPFIHPQCRHPDIDVHDGAECYQHVQRGTPYLVWANCRRGRGGEGSHLPLSHHLTLGMLPPTLACIHNITHMHTLPVFLRNITQPQMPILLRRSVLNYPIALVAHFIILCCGGLALVQLRAFREYDPSVTVVSHCCSCQQHRAPGHALGTRS